MHARIEFLIAAVARPLATVLQALAYQNTAMLALGLDEVMLNGPVAYSQGFSFICTFGQDIIYQVCQRNRVFMDTVDSR